jgi:CRISPR-associated exonuclease Cas4
MTPDEAAQAGQTPGLGQVPLSALEHHDYCPRQAGLILLESAYADDAATTRGTLLHQHVHEPGSEMRDGIRILRALPVWHDSLGLTGVCDVVEIHPDGTIVPVEHKSGSYHPGGPADVQLAGQAVCLETMFKVAIPAGAIFASSDRRRHQVEITPELRQRVIRNAASVRQILNAEILPAALSGHRCRRCSMNGECMPRVLTDRKAFAKAAASLFTVPEGEPGPWDD